ncbi:hypothetical protein ONZ45_g8876 [Pleurotus djamor]|nr:hypothetical protein ONZ45_g8876 [Pleurotus djamor]
MSSIPLDHNASNAQHSLAHELAVALMPEPNPGSRLLAEEFGIEYDEGAEGIDADSSQSSFAMDDDAVDNLHFQTSQPPQDAYLHDMDASFASPPPPLPTSSSDSQDQAAMTTLARSLESTDHFLAHLRNLDSDTHSQSHSTIEHITSDIIRRINDTVRDREEQVRELLEAEREFRKISVGIGGNEVLGDLDELDTADIEEPETPTAMVSPIEPRRPTRTDSANWEDDPTDSFSKPPPIRGPLTPAKVITQLGDFRSFTSSLNSSLIAISEQTQVTGAATTEAGRKIRALKNKIGVWRIELDSAELSRLRVERWEAGLSEGDGEIAQVPSAVHRRIDGRKVVAEHLRSFELHLAEATTKTQAIMAM